MRSRRSIVALILTVLSMQALDAKAVNLKSLLHPKERKMEAQLMLSCIQSRSWMAYLKNDKGEIAPVRDTQGTDDDEDWLGLRFTDYDGPRIRLGVLKVINKSAESEERGYADRIEVPVAGIQEMLTVALFNTKRFDVIEQKRVGEIKSQQTRADLLDPSPKSILNMGKVMGAQYLVYGTVNEWDPDRGSRKVGPGRIFSAGKHEAEVSITFTLSDVASGQNLFTTTERARMGEWSFSSSGGPDRLPGGLPGGGGTQATEQKTPVSYAVRVAANKAAFKIATFLRDQKWKGSVVDVKGADVYINAGSQQGMTLQTKLSVLAVKGLVKDGESGTLLGEDTRGIGTLEVVSVQTGFSIARTVETSQKVKTGDRVELATPRQLPPVSPECAARDGSVAP